MSREEIRNLIGGYATGNLTEAERTALFAAVMEDQELFDALAREQPLAELLEDPAARARLLAALGEPELPWGMQVWGWMRRPAVAALAASAAVAVLALVVLLPRGARREEAKPVQVAEARKEAAAAPEQAPPPKPRAKPKPPAKPKREEPRVVAQAQAPAETAAEAAPSAAPVADSAAGAAFRPRRSVLSRSTYRTESGALRATVVRLTPEGSYEPLAEDAALGVGDAVRLRVEAATAGYLRVLQRETQQGWRPIFSGKVEAGSACFVPAEGSLRLGRGRREFVLSLTGAEGQAAQVSERVVLEVK